MKTLYDLVSRILDSRDGYGDPVNTRRALRAAVWGYQQVSLRHRWNDYNTSDLRVLYAPVEITASIATDGTVTVSEGTIPAWIDLASMQLEHHNQVVAYQVSGTEFLLDGYDGPEVASITTKLVNNRMVILDSMIEIFAIRNVNTNTDMLFADTRVFRDSETMNQTAVSEPTHVVSVRYNHRGRRRTELRFSPAPSSQTSVRLDYYRGQRLATLAHDCGTVAITSSGTVTLSKPISSRHATTLDTGSLILLLSSDELLPDADIGFSVVDDNVPEAELDVTEINSNTTITVDSTDEVTDRGAILTHVLDLPQYTWEAAAMFAEAKYMQIGEGSVGEFWQTMKMAENELRNAMEQEGTLSRSAISPRSRASTYTRPDTIDLEA